LGHSRENGNPGSLGRAKAKWIPAFAGMTGREAAFFVGAKPFFEKGPL